jgi:hypothetical protein
LATTVSAVIDTKMQIKETIELTLDNVSNPTLSHEIAGGSKTLNATSTPAVSKAFSDQRTLSGGSDTLDLTAAPGPTVNGSATTIDFTGLKIQAFKFKAKSTNSAVILIGGHATDGYEPFSNHATGIIQLAAGEEIMMVFLVPQNHSHHVS